jgi:hypothetical protein
MHGADRARIAARCAQPIKPGPRPLGCAKDERQGRFQRSGGPTGGRVPWQSLLSEFLADLRHNFGAEQLNAVEEHVVGHAANIHL